MLLCGCTWCHGAHAMMQFCADGGWVATSAERLRQGARGAIAPPGAAHPGEGLRAHPEFGELALAPLHADASRLRAVAEGVVTVALGRALF